MTKGNYGALLPIGVFLTLYLGLGIVFEYVLKITMGFYNVPIVVVFLVALLVACLQNRKLPFEDKLTVMAKGVGDPNILTMVLIFLIAGMFVGVVGRESGESVAYLMLSLIPSPYAVAVLFVVSAFVSLAMGTSVGTITLIVPIAVAVSKGSGFPLALCIGSVVGGSMFGDNLSFISDTTIAACNGQGCAMKDKFRENFAIALPAAIVAVLLLLLRCKGIPAPDTMEYEYHLLQIVPYLVVLAGGILGISVFVVLIMGIVCGMVVMFATGGVTLPQLVANMGTGVSGMFETAIVAVLVSAICALIKENGGFAAILQLTRRLFKGKKSGMLGIGLLVGIMDIATANNTVAIVMANPIAKDMSADYGITPSRTASILDTFSCIFQGMLPYGAQMLIAVSVAAELGQEVSAFSILANLFYPYTLLLSSLVFIYAIESTKR